VSPTHKELIFDFADLKLISVVCKGANGKPCSAEIIMDVSVAFKEMPRACPVCGNQFDALFDSALESFQSAYKNFTKAEGNTIARLRIRRQIDSAEF